MKRKITFIVSVLTLAMYSTSCSITPPEGEAIPTEELFEAISDKIDQAISVEEPRVGDVKTNRIDLPNGLYVGQPHRMDAVSSDDLTRTQRVFKERGMLDGNH